MTSQFPILEFDPAREAVNDPSRFIKPGNIPAQGVICFFPEAVRQKVEKGQARPIGALRGEFGVWPIYALDHHGQQVGLFHPGNGAPMAAVMLEEVIALGCRRFVAVGGCGVLEPELTNGHLLVPAAAVRDEGTSYHYLPPAREVAASPAAIAAIERVIRRRGLNYLLTKTWTTDAPYRETPERTARRQAEGCLAVEMEAAAFFAVAAFRGVQCGQILYGGDAALSTAALGTAQINPAVEGRDWTSPAKIRSHLVDLAAEACLEIE